MAIDINIFLMYNFSEKRQRRLLYHTDTEGASFFVPETEKACFFTLFGGSYGRYYI